MIAASQRFTRSRPCAICGGYDNALRGRGMRCYGFISDDGTWIHCTREERAGNLPQHPNSGTYAHRSQGDCACGMPHGGAVAVSPTALPTPHRHHRHTDAPEGEYEGDYVYFDPDRRPLHRTVRYRNPKSFRQQRYDHGAWRWGLRDTQTVLYRLPELLEADPRLPVFLTEGERDACRLALLGQIATTNPCGARTWDSRFGLWLQGRHVAIVEDNDEAGRERTRRVTRTLIGLAASVRILSFPNLREGGDVSDWLDAGGTVAELLERLESPASQLMEITA